MRRTQTMALVPTEKKEARTVADSTGKEQEESRQRQETDNPIISQMPKLLQKYLDSPTDMGNVARLWSYSHNLTRFGAQSNKWIVWNGKFWNAEYGNTTVRRFAHQIPLAIYEQAKLIADEERRDIFYAWAIKSSQSSRFEAVLREAPAYFLIDDKKFDSDPLLFNCKNGTIDLSTGQCYDHQLKDYISKMSPIEYEASAQCPEWDKFLLRIFDGNTELIQFMQRAVGYTLSGLTSAHCLFFLYGEGHNGKSQFTETIKTIMGNYGQKAPTDMLMMKKSGWSGIPNDIAALCGARMAVTSELDQTQKFNESKLKDLSSDDTLTGRFLHHEYFDFQPTHKLWIYGNHKPIITGRDNGIWRRIHLIPFTVTIPEKDRIIDFRKHFLYPERAGILNWAIRGFLELQQNNMNLNPPKCVQYATDQYRAENDIYQQFINQYCDFSDKQAFTPTKELLDLIREEYGYSNPDAKRLASLLEEHGAWNDKKRIEGKQYRGWSGVSLLS